jgi:hypothetical protein
MAINDLQNRRIGPGGGARHLHHISIYGGELRIDERNKGMFFARHGTAVIGLNK